MQININFPIHRLLKLTQKYTLIKKLKKGLTQTNIYPKLIAKLIDRI